MIISEQAQTRAMILDLVQQKGIVQATSASFVQTVGNQEQQANMVDEKEVKTRNWFLDSLGFSAMQDRQDEVAQAYHTTFEWMFDEPRQQKESLPWTNFVDWLWRGEGLYWVNGKAGSGKSTLMKYIYNHRKTAETLSQWSGSMPILVATFFFWNSGTPEQRSQVGLLRSLLFQVLQHRPILIPLLFPEEYASLQSHTTTRAEEYPRRSWSLARLQGALDRLVELDDLPLKLCFFIDGLDEFEGNEDNNDRQHMIHLLRRLASSRFIKVCLSSRPLLIFEESFRNDPGLRLQDLTSGDIKKYVVDKLSMDPGMRLIADHEPTRRHDFIKEICDKAQGVFLWVKLVVRSLLDGLNNSDRMMDLRARLDDLPNDLEDLYRHMVGNIDKLYLIKTSQIFQMVQTARYIQGQRSISTQRTTPVTVLLLALALEDRPEVDLITVSEAWITKNLSNLCDIMRRRLQTWCAGLLEVPDFIWNRVNALDADATVRTKITWEVAFLHRTARDFIESEPVWRSLTAFTENTNFDPSTSLLQSTVLVYQLAGRLVNNPLGYGLFKHEILEPATHAMILAKGAYVTDDNAHIALLDELDLAISRHLLRWTGNYIGHWSQYLDVAITADSVLSMLDLAVLYGLHRYVRARLLRLYAQDPENPGFLHIYLREDLSNTARPRRTITLLDMAIRPDCPSPETAQVLLEFGADPNEQSGYQALFIWEHIMKRAQASQRLDNDSAKWLQIMDIFIQYDVDLRGNHRDRKVAHQNIFDLLKGFEATHPVEVAGLQKLVDKKLRSKRNQLKVWAGDKMGSKKTSPNRIRSLG